MIRNKNELNDYLKYELKNYNCGFLKFVPIDVSERQILYKHILLLRKAEYYNNIGNNFMGTFYLVKLHFLQNKYGIHIPLNTCAKGLSIAHVGNIVINGRAHIGENCRIHVGVNIGEGSRGGVPTIGNNVFIGPGAKLFNDIYIADEIKIGANAVVNRTFNQIGASVGGVPAKILKSNKSEK